MTDRFKIIESIQPWPTATICGEIDHSNVRQARISVDRLLKEGSTVLILDLTSVPYMDTSGAALVFWVAKELVDRGGQLRIVFPSGHVRRALDLYGIQRIESVKLYANLELALEEYPKER